jgi:hypothetical protein
LRDTGIDSPFKVVAEFVFEVSLNLISAEEGFGEPSPVGTGLANGSRRIDRS